MNGKTQTEFHWLFAHAKPTVRIDEVALALGIDPTQVRAHVDQGNFLAVPINDAAPELRKREHLRLFRWSVEGYALRELDRQGNQRPPVVDPLAAWWAGCLAPGGGGERAEDRGQKADVRDHSP